MPPKNKGTSKKAKPKAPTLIDGLTKEEMSKEQLEEHIVQLREELDREREERNYFQLERDKIHTFWDIADKQVQEAKAELKNIDKDIEEDEGHHQVEIKVYKQKMKHLLCEHQNTISELKAEGSVASEVVQQEQRQLETGLHNEMRSIMVDIQELNNESLVKKLQLKHEEEMTETRNTLEKQLTEIEAKYEEKMKSLLQELDNMKKNDISEREDHWNSHITTLMENHNKTFSEAQALVKSLQHNMEENESLKTEIQQMKMEKAVKEKDLISVSQDNKHLTELIIKVNKENDEMEKKMKYSSWKKNTNANIKEKELSDLKWDYEALEQKFSKLQLERDKLYKTYTENIEKVQDKADAKTMQLERKLEALADRVESTQAQLCAVLSASNLDHTALGGVIDKIEENLDSSNNSIMSLQHKKALISKARTDLLLTYEAKLRALGVPVEEINSKPSESSRPGKSLEQDLE